MTAQTVLSEHSVMRIRTSRIGLITIHARAPITQGRVSDSQLTFTVRIDEVNTGNPLLDPELHALIHQVSSGTLTFSGTRSGEVYSGEAVAGQISVPLALAATMAEEGLALAGTSTFHDIHVPLPGMGHIKHLEVDIDGHLRLA